MGKHIDGRIAPDFPLLTREQIESHIEALIALLDRLDGDADFEPDRDLEPDADGEPDGTEDEPSLGGGGFLINGTLHYDLELDHADDEPLLGWTEDGDAGQSTFNTDECELEGV